MMKHILATIIFLCSFSGLFSQSICSSWQGKLDVMGSQLVLIFRIDSIDNKFSATMDVPTQGAKNIAATIEFSEQKNLLITVPTLKIEYKGILLEDSIKGEFQQAGFRQALVLRKASKVESLGLKRPQTPKAPFPYNEEELKFKNKKANDIQLAGTLCLSKEKKTPQTAVILISGSGPQNRNEEIFGHQPFAVIADYLARKNIGVLRFDDRGCFESKGDFSIATTEDFASDVEAAIEYLLSRKEIDKNNIFLIGHSEGAIIATMVAAKRSELKGIVLLAGTGVKGEQVLMSQTRSINKLMGLPKEKIEEAEKINKKIFDLVMVTKNKEELSEKIKPLLESAYTPLTGLDKETFVNQQLEALLSPWFRYFIGYNPVTDLAKVKCSVLALNGEKDIQVDADINLTAIASALKEGGNKNIKIKKFPNLNHLFQTCKTGNISEYGTIEETFSPLVLETIGRWIAKESSEKR